MIGLSEAVTLSFMVTDHTKFSPDWSFGLLKKEFAVNTLDIAEVVDISAACNVAEIVGPTIPTNNWTRFFAGKTVKIQGIKGYHQFHFVSSARGKVSCLMLSGSPSKLVNVVKVDKKGNLEWNPTEPMLPDVIKPVGLDAKRQ